MGANKEQLDEFLDYLGQSLTRIQSLCNSAHDGQCRSFKKALLFSFVDNLSSLAYPTKKKDSARARKLMTQYGRWTEGSLVSTPHLCRWIEVHPKGLLQGGIELAKSRLEGWEHGTIVPISRDLNYSDIQSHINPDNKEAAQSILRLTHASLLWNQRHSLIHKFMPIGISLEFPDDVDPYYMSLSSLSAIADAVDANSFWQLIYPTGFLFSLARECLQGVSLQLRAGSIDIRAHYQVGRYLWEELN